MAVSLVILQHRQTYIENNEIKSGGDCKLLTNVSLGTTDRKLRIYFPWGACVWNVRTYDALWGAAVAQWLRCCATNRKVAGSIPAGAIGIIH